MKIIFSNFKKEIFNFSHLAFGEFASKAFGFFTTVYLARVLGADGFGLYGFVTAISAYVILFSNFGIDQYSSQFLAARSTENNSSFIRTVLTTRLAASLLLLIPYLVFAYSYARSSHDLWLFVFQSISILAFSLNLQFFFVAYQQLFLQAIVKIAAAVLIFLFSIWLVRSSSDLPLVTLIGGGITLIVFAAAVIIIFRRNGMLVQVPGKTEIASLLRNAAPLGLSTLMVQIYYSADIVFLGFTNPGVELGYYTGAYKIILLFTMVPAMVYQTFLPLLATVQSEYFSSRTTKTYISILTGAGLFITIPSYIGAEFIIRIVLGDAYVPAVGVFKILLVNVLLVFINVALGNLLIAWNQHKRYLVVVTSGAAANILANIVLIPSYGIYGAAIATVIAEGAVFAAAVYYHYKLFGIIKVREF